MASNNNVSVAVRIRPKLQKEAIDMCNICTRVTPNEPQVWLGHDKAFTFDHVFDVDTNQHCVYDRCVRTLVEGCFEGYNATVLAYGQTGSGKTYTMGTGFDVSCPEDQLGIIPRAVAHLFQGIQRRKEEAKQQDLPMPEFSVSAQFIEIYNEELKDLLCEKSRKNMPIRIQEDYKRGIILTGVETKTVHSAEDTLACLKSGSLFRTTGATLMNAESSRSHAIFTLFIKQNRVDRIEMNGNDATNVAEQELVTLTAKFNFVDLAGSERLSRTGAVGERAREGISINSGLLHLGNVISALGDRSKKASHIPYRDSKLTRVLQDSLGGNSVTTMIACISPCDRDFVETLNTLRYANRAKNIKNKVVANQDSQTQLINELRKQLMQLELENKELRQGKMLVKNDGELELNDVYLENEMLQRDLNNANIRIKALNTRLDEVTGENISLKENIALGQIQLAQNGESGEDCAEVLIKGYLKEINDLRSKVIESEHLISYYRKQLNQRENELLYEHDGLDIIEKCKQEIEMGKTRLLNQMNSSKDGVEEITEEEQEEFEDNDDEDIDEEFEKKIAGQNAELATLMEMIASKEKLIEEAEARQRRIVELTEHYEQKISSFKNKIKQTEEERDLLISKLHKNKDDQSSKRVKEEFEKKLAALQKDIRKYENLKREHQKVLRNEINSKEQLKKLRQEIIEAKQQRVKLISQMKEQMNKHNREIQKNRLVINKLTREDHRKDVKIRDLEVQSNLQRKMLQRREEEIKALRKQVKPMSDKVAGRLGRLKHGVSGHTPQKARNKWVNFEQKFNQLVNQRISFEQEEKKLERYLCDRQTNLTLLNTLKENEEGDYEEEYIESIKMNIDFLTKCIEDTQNVIMQLEDDNINTDQLFHNLDSDEVMYILSKLANSAVNYAIMASQKDEEIKEKDAKLNTLWNENVYSNHLLNYMVAKNFDDENGLYPSNLVVPPFEPPQSAATQSVTPVSEKDKFRRYTRTPNELLFDMNKPTTIGQQQQQQINSTGGVGVDLNQTYIANSIPPKTGANLSDLKEESDNSLNTTYVKNYSPKETNNLMNDTFVVMDNSSKENNSALANTQNRSNTTFVLEKPSSAEMNQTIVLSTSNNNNKSSQYSQSVTSEKPLIDRMTQSLHVDNNASTGVANQTNGNGGTTTVPPTATIFRKSSFNSPADLNRVPSAPSLKELSNPTLGSSPLPPHHYLLSPHLLRRKIYQQQQQAVNGCGSTYSTGVYYEAANNNSAAASALNNNHHHSTPHNNKTRLTRSTSTNNGHGSSGGGNNNHHYQNNSVNNNSPLLGGGGGSVSSTTSSGYNSLHHHQLSPQSSPSLSSRHAFLHKLPMNKSNISENSVGKILPNVNFKSDKSFPLMCTHTIVGHRRAVLTVTATNEVLFSGSKDGTAKIWDLNKCEEVYSLNDHPDAVNVVRYDEFNKLIYTCSKSTIKIWDPRENPVNCVRTLCNSSGLVTSENVSSENNSIADIRLSADGSTLFSTAEKLVRVWDLRSVQCVQIGKLTTGHKSLVTCLAVDDEEMNDTRLVVTGSKDHTVKVFELDSRIVGIHIPKYTLKPPHYDGIEALKLIDRGRFLFSGARDGCIKKWDLSEQRMMATLGTSHRDWVLALDTFMNESYLLSACRGGFLKMWSTENCRLLGEIQAHPAAINSIATISQAAFTASSDCSISLWQYRADSINPLDDTD